MKRKITHNNLIQRKIFTLVAVALLLLITLTSCSNASPPVYTVTFNANGGFVDGKESITSEVAGGTAVKEPSDPIRDGYLFDGWCIEGQSEAYDFSTPVNSNLTLEAKWTRLYYKVTFNADGGTFSGDDSITVASGDTVSSPTASPTKDRYRFDGWYVEGASEAYNFSTPVNSDLTLVAKWTITECIVTFNLDEGSFSGDESVTVDAGKAISKPVAPTKTGYLFAGWIEEGSYTYYDFSTQVNRDLTLVAIWTAENTLSFALDNTASGYIVSQETTAAPSGWLAIPDTYSGQPVVTIDDFSGANITAVTIPASVETIGYNAFESCTSLRTVMFESGSKLSEIGDGAFYNTAIESIEIPASVTIIGESAFDACTSLSSVTFESGSKLYTIDNYAFNEIAITNIEIPASVMDMGSSVFYGCTKLQTIKIGTETIPSGWVSDWKDYCDATVINSNNEIIDYYSVTFNANDGTIAGETSLIAKVAEGTTVEEPIDPKKDGYLFAGWFEEGSYTYYDFNAPVNGDLTIVAAWTDENTLSFDLDNTAGGYIVSQGTTAPSGWLAIPDTYEWKPVVAIDSDAFEGNDGITAVTIPASVETISNDAFSYCTSLSTVTFESGSRLSEIVSGAFAESGLTSIEIPASVIKIDESAFEFCTSLSTVTFESGSRLAEIWNYAFSMTAITSIEIPASVIDMGISVFAGCTKLETIKIGTENIPSGWNDRWKNGCTATVINSNNEAI